MRITRKLQLNTLIVLALLVLNGVVAVFLVQRMMGDVRQLVEVEEPLEEAVLEMEINVGETARAVLDYIRDHDERDIERMHDSERDFEHYAKEFERLAETDKERALGRQVAMLYRDFKEQGDEITRLTRQRDAALQTMREITEGVDELLDGRLKESIDLSAPDALEKTQALASLDEVFDESFGKVEAYVADAYPALRRELMDVEADFERCLAQYRETSLSADEEKWLDQIDEGFGETVITVNKIITLTAQMHEKLERFETNLEEIDRILDDEIQVLIHEQTVLAAEDAQRSGEIAIAFILGTGIFILLIVAGVSRIVSKGIISATDRLAEGAVQFGRGNLEHRIEVPTMDELGSLARTFNHMAEALQQSTASRNELLEEVQTRERVEKELVKALEQEKRAAHELESTMSQLKAAMSELEVAASTDKLTGLPNRAILMERLQQVMKRSNRDGSRFAILFLDFDRFKLVNDGLGHNVGDQLLMSIAERLKENLRAGDSAARVDADDSDNLSARLGGDEFVILLDRIKDVQDATLVAERIQKSLEAPHKIGRYEVTSTASIGIVTSELEYDSADEMLRDADIAMYRAKAAGGARHQVFDRAMHHEAVIRLELESDLRHALQHEQFRLVYQPIIDLRTSLAVGFEALIRWDHPERGVISPMDFIPVAEETGLIVPIGGWVLLEACQQLKQWQDQFSSNPPLSMNVNISKRQLTQSELIETIEHVLTTTRIEPRTLNLEITETAIMDSLDEFNPVLQPLRACGVFLCIDDFGTGHSSLSCLHEFPIDVLKIDRAFLDNIKEDREYVAVTQAIVTLAQNLGMGVVAEGVETPEQVAMLQALDADYAQGFYFAKPLRPEDAAAFLQNQRPLARSA